MTIKTILTGIWVLIYWIFSVALLFFWVKGIIHSVKKHSEMDVFFSTLPPWGIYRGIESYWHKDENSESEIDWSKRIPDDDVSTAFLLISYSQDKDDIDKIKMEIEEFSKKVNSYPRDKKAVIENGVINYLKFNISATKDNIDFMRKLIKDSTTRFDYSSLSNKYYDSISKFYQSPEMITLKKAMDSMIPIERENLKNLPSTVLDSIVNESMKGIYNYNSLYHSGFKRIFNEDYN